MKRSFIILFLSFFPSVFFCQTTITGKVTEKKGNPLPFANVTIKDSNRGAVTDSIGNYSFIISDTGTVILSAIFFGYEKQEQKVTLLPGSLIINFELFPQASQLNEVIISAGTFEASDEKKAIAFKPRDIVTTAGGNGDIASALQTLPGVQPQAQEEGLFVRGGAASETKTVIDEMIVQSPFFSSVPDVPQKGRFSPFLFKGTIFSSGGYSALYGQALSSALILKTEDLPNNTYTGIGILPFGTNLSHTHKWEKNALSVEGNYANMKPYFSVIKQKTDWNNEPESFTGALIYRQKISKTGIFKFYANFNNTSLSMFYPDINNLPNKIKFDLKSQNIYTNTSLREILNNHWFFFIGASYSKESKNSFQNNFDISDDNELIQGKVILTRNLLKNSNFKFGGEIQKQNSAAHFYNSDSISYIRKLNELYSAFFAETELYITKNIAARVGMRAEYSAELSQTAIAPRLSLALKTTENSQVSFAYGNFYQSPENRFLFQSRDLTFENANHYIFNYQWIKNKRLFRIEIYDKEYRHLVKYNPELVINNSGFGYARGIDLFWRDNKKTFKNIDYWVSYSYLDTKRNYKDFPILAVPTFVSAHVLSFVYKHSIPKIKTTIGTTYSFASGRHYYNPAKSLNEFNSDITKDYHNLSINISKIISVKNFFIVLYGSMNNALGGNHIFGYRYSIDGSQRIEIGPSALRTFFLGMFISIEKKPK